MIWKKIVFGLLVSGVSSISQTYGDWPIKASWDQIESDAVGTEIYISSVPIPDGTATEDLVGDIHESFTKRTSFCYQGSGPRPKYVFVALVTRDSGGARSVPVIGYLLRGNIYGIYEDGVPYGLARVDGQDLSTLGTYFGEITTHQSIDCSENFTIESRSLKQRSDLNKDGQIDEFDLAELNDNFGNMIPWEVFYDESYDHDIDFILIVAN